MTNPTDQPLPLPEAVAHCVRRLGPALSVSVNIEPIACHPLVPRTLYYTADQLRTHAASEVARERERAAREAEKYVGNWWIAEDIAAAIRKG